MPLKRDPHGNLGVAGEGGGGIQQVMIFPSVRNQRDARAIRATMGQRAREFIGAANRRTGMRP